MAENGSARLGRWDVRPMVRRQTAGKRRRRKVNKGNELDKERSRSDGVT